MIDLEKNIKKFLSDRRISVVKFCADIGITNPGLYKIYKRGSIDTSYLEKISEVYDIPICYLLENEKDKEHQTKVRLESNESLIKENEMLKEGVKILKNLVDTKDELIKELKKRK